MDNQAILPIKLVVYLNGDFYFVWWGAGERDSRGWTVFFVSEYECELYYTYFIHDFASRLWITLSNFSQWIRNRQKKKSQKSLTVLNVNFSNFSYDLDDNLVLHFHS